MTAEDAIAALRAHADPDRAASMRAYHKQTRDLLGLPDAVTGALAAEWRQHHDLPGLVALARGLWASDIFEARLAAGKLFLKARIRPEDGPAWDCLTDFVPGFDSWAIADAVAQSGQKRLLQDPTRLDEVEHWVTSDHMWTRHRGAGFHPALHQVPPPQRDGGRRPNPHPRLVRNARPRPRLVHPQSHRLVAARPVQTRPRHGCKLACRPWRRPQTLRPQGSRQVPAPLTAC